MLAVSYRRAHYACRIPILGRTHAVDRRQRYPDRSTQMWDLLPTITWLLSLMGCPVVTVPCGYDHRGLPFGLPFGVQLVGRRYQDARLLDIAAAIEQALNDKSLGRFVPDISGLEKSERLDHRLSEN